MICGSTGGTLPSPDDPVNKARQDGQMQGYAVGFLAALRAIQGPVTVDAEWLRKELEKRRWP